MDMRGTHDNKEISHWPSHGYRMNWSILYSDDFKGIGEDNNQRRRTYNKNMKK